MFDEFSLIMGILDYIPIILFIVGLYYIVLFIRQSPFFSEINQAKYAQFVLVGGIIGSIGAVFKATWKVIIGATDYDVVIFRESLFVFQAIGFSIMTIALVLAYRSIKSDENQFSEASLAPMAVWKIPFLGITIISMFIWHLVLIQISRKLKDRVATFLIIFSFLVMFIMSGLSNSATIAKYEWLAQTINTFGQLAFALAARMLYKPK